MNPEYEQVIFSLDLKQFLQLMAPFPKHNSNNRADLSEQIISDFLNLDEGSSFLFLHELV